MLRAVLWLMGPDSKLASFVLIRARTTQQRNSRGATQQGRRLLRLYALALMKGLVAPMPAVGVVPGDGLDAVAVQHLFFGVFLGAN